MLLFCFTNWLPLHHTGTNEKVIVVTKCCLGVGLNLPCFPPPDNTHMVRKFIDTTSLPRSITLGWMPPLERNVASYQVLYLSCPKSVQTSRKSYIKFYHFSFQWRSVKKYRLNNIEKKIISNIFSLLYLYSFLETTFNSGYFCDWRIVGSLHNCCIFNTCWCLLYILLVVYDDQIIQFSDDKMYYTVTIPLYILALRAKCSFC